MQHFWEPSYQVQDFSYGKKVSQYWCQHYNHENNALGNVRHYDSSLYVAVPRWRDGVPSTLNVIGVTMSKKAQRNEKKMSPKLKPFPNLASNIVGDCKAMQSVAAIEIDPRGWLWVADSGEYLRPLDPRPHGSLLKTCVLHR